MLFKLSLKNIRKSIKDYVIYFFTLIVGVAIFYVFNAIDSQTVMLDVSENTYEIINLMTEMLSGVSVFVSMILGFLIIYASRFLIKRRNKEFGIYLTLGMGRRSISLILFFETLIIGLLSLAVGLLVGVGASQLMSAFVADMFEADMTRFQFVFSESACKKTMLYFGIMYLLVMIFNTVSVSRCKLIDLIQSEKRMEQVKMKNPFLCVLVFLAAAWILGRAYYMVTAGMSDMQSADKILVPIGMGILGTFLVFWSLSGLLLRICMSSKKLYYRGLNCFTLRQISSQINTTVCSMSIICLMLFLTIGVLSACFSIKNSLNMQLDEMAPVDIQIGRRMNLSSEDKADGYTDRQIATSRLCIDDYYRAAGFNIDARLSESIRVKMYHDDGFTMGAFLGDCIEEIQKQYPFLHYETPETIMNVSDYNRVANLMGKNRITIAEDEYAVVADFSSMVTLRDWALRQGQTIDVFGRTLKPKYDACQDGFLEIGSQHTNTGIFVVPDSVTEDVAVWSEYLLGNYKAETKEEKQRTENEIKRVNEDERVRDWLSPAINSRIDICESATGIGAMAAFIGIYLGTVFLISGAAILALKQLSESADNRARYQRLRQLGAEETMINKALFYQIGIFFLAPLLLALIHSIFGIKFSIIVLEIFGTVGMLRSMVTTAVILLIIYGGYFLLTYWCSKNIIREAR